MEKLRATKTDGYTKQAKGSFECKATSNPVIAAAFSNGGTNSLVILRYGGATRVVLPNTTWANNQPFGYYDTTRYMWDFEVIDPTKASVHLLFIDFTEALDEEK